MQIQLKQAEIVSALKQYLDSQGINIKGKSVTIGFTAGRKETGLTADISIEDLSTEIPGFTDMPSDESTNKQPALVVVQAQPQNDAAEPAPNAEEPVAASPATSLFG